MRDVLRSGFLSKGRHLRPFEEAAAEHLGVTHAVVVSSGTTGLMLAYQALGLTCEVVVPSFTFMATVCVLVWVGARPAFAEVIAGTTNLDPAEAEAAVPPQTSAIAAVHNHGNPADIAELRDVALRRGLPLLDAGGRHRNRLADLYQSELASLPGLGFQEVRKGSRSSYKDFSITVEPPRLRSDARRTRVGLGGREHRDAQVLRPARPPSPCHRRFAPADGLPDTELMARGSPSLPIWSDMDLPS